MGITEQIAERNKQVKDFNKAVSESKIKSGVLDKKPLVLITPGEVFQGIALVLSKAIPLLTGEKIWGTAVKLLSGFFQSLANSRLKNKGKSNAENNSKTD